jgi:hypothetical protein
MSDRLTLESVCSEYEMIELMLERLVKVSLQMMMMMMMMLMMMMMMMMMRGDCSFSWKTVATYIARIERSYSKIQS